MGGNAGVMPSTGHQQNFLARVVKSVDAADSKSVSERSAGSSPASGTKIHVSIV